jgi:glycerol-1-phosphate dehydrogenase [NAD(P)+]
VLETRVQIDVSAETASNRSLERLIRRVSVRTMKLETLCPVPLPDDADLQAFLTQEVECGPGVASTLADAVVRHAGERPLVVADPDTWRAAESAGATAALNGELRHLGAHPHADDAEVDALSAAIRQDKRLTGVVAVGSGTVNDIVKRASHLAGLPYVVLGTAASMNGYTSGIAAILSDGLKTTVPATPPRAVILDAAILRDAPPELTRAGLGDLISKPVSDSDWWLADALEGSGYSRLPGAIVEVAMDEATGAAAGLASGDLEAYAALGRALLLSGVSMVVAGSSSPASGGEHLLSHLWDMRALAAGGETRLHGAQVGVATRVSAALYHRVMQVQRADPAPAPDWDNEAARIREVHGTLAEVVLPQAQRKHARATARADALRDRWPEIREGLEARDIPTPDRIGSILAAAGAPATFADLGVGRDEGVRTLLEARDIRDRVTILDVAFELGVLPGDADAVIDAAGV